MCSGRDRAADRQRRRVGPDLYGRHARRGQGRAGHRARRRGHHGERRHQRGPVGRDERGGRVLLPWSAARHLHRARGAGGLQDRRAPRPADRHAADDHDGLHARGRCPRRADHRSRHRAGGRALDGQRRHDDDGGADHRDSPLRPQHVLHRDRHARRDQLRRPAVRALPGPVGRVAAVARRRTAARQRLHDRGRVDHRHVEPRLMGALDRRRRGHEGAAQDLRRRDGSGRRRGVQRHREIGLQLLARQHAVHEQAGLGHRQAVLRQDRRHAQPAAVLLLVGGLGRRPGREGQDVLLVQQGRLHAEEHAEQRAHVPDRPRACRRLLAVRHHDLRPAHHPAEPERHRLHPRPVPGQRHSRQSPQPDRAEHAHADADADLGPLVQQSGQPRRRTAGSGNGEDRSALELEVDDHRHVCPPAHG